MISKIPQYYFLNTKIYFIINAKYKLSNNFIPFKNAWYETINIPKEREKYKLKGLGGNVWLDMTSVICRWRTKRLEKGRVGIQNPNAMQVVCDWCFFVLVGYEESYEMRQRVGQGSL